MTALTGTDKQIAWAEQIRSQAIAAVESIANAPDNTPEMIAQTIAWMGCVRNAVWWIEKRHWVRQPENFIRKVTGVIVG